MVGMAEPPDTDALDGEDSLNDDSRRYASLDRALFAHGIPLENHPLIRRFTAEIGIAAFFERGPYIKAVRKQSGPALNINYGWTNGFVSEDEVINAAGEDLKRWPSGRGTGLWGITHPIHGHASSSGGAARPARNYGVCPRCHMQLPASGRCSDCED